ncbi:MAG: acyloxyacyl hydrolase [Acidobacteriota bacterium]
MRNPIWQGLLLLLLAGGPMAAQLWPPGPPVTVAANAGTFEVLDSVSAYEMGWELRYAPRRFRFLPRWAPDLMPTAGVMATTRGVIYPYAGFRFEIPLGDRWVLSPGTAAGLYYRDHGKNLGGGLEFRSHIELSFRLPWQDRIGISFYHLSNANLFDFNPGTESAVVTYTAKLRR